MGSSRSFWGQSRSEALGGDVARAHFGAASCSEGSEIRRNRMASRGSNEVTSYCRFSLLALITLCASCGSGDKSPVPARIAGDSNGAPAEPLLSRAIRALGGKTVLSSVKSLKLRSLLRERERSLDVDLHIELPESYRHDVLTGDAHLVHATNGRATWATIDNVPVSLEMEEIARLSQQLDLVRLSLLVGLDDQKAYRVAETGVREGLEWLEVRFLKGEKSAYSLGFDTKSALLSRAEWEAHVYGADRKLKLAVELKDYRVTAGIMVPYLATFVVEREPTAENVVKDVAVNEPVDADLFVEPMPAKEPPVQRRKTPPGHAAILRFEHGRVEDAERLLLAWVKDHLIQRNGPAFRFHEGEKFTAVGIPCRNPTSSPEGSTESHVPKVLVLPETEVISTIVTPVTVEALSLAERRLSDRAEFLELERVGPFKHVAWNEDITQIQLPVRTRPK